MNTIEKFNGSVMHTYGRFNAVLEKGSGRCCTDENGREYIDFGSGIGTNSLGFCDNDWADAVCAQVRTLQHNSNYYYTKVQADFAEALCSTTRYSKVFFGNSGAEANECAIKLARKYSFDKYGKGRHNIVTLKNSFHGRTLCTLSATGQDSFHNYFFPFVEGFVNAEANNIDDLKSRLDGTVCAVMIEFIQGEGGVFALDEEYVRELFSLCRENDILVITDEVQTGAGRTGRFLAAEHYGVHADIVTLAKGLAGGIPIGACLANKKCSEVLSAGTHGSTFGGNPVACAGGLAVIKKVTAPGFLDETAKKSEYFREQLHKISGVKSISGKGLMIGIELENGDAHDIAEKCLERGLLVLTAKTKVRLLPPLNITYDEIDRGLKIFKEVLEV